MQDPDSLPPRPSWAGPLQTALGLLLVLVGITGLAYPLLAALEPADHLQGQAGAPPDLSPADSKYFERPAVDAPADIPVLVAYAQMGRVAANRSLPVTQVQALITRHAHGRLLGEPQVNVLELNHALDQQSPPTAQLTRPSCVHRIEPARGCRPGR